MYSDFHTLLKTASIYWGLNMHGCSKQTTSSYTLCRKKTFIFWLEFYGSISLRTKNSHDANFVMISCTGGCHNDNLLSHQWWQSWHHDNSWFSMIPWYLIANKSATSYLSGNVQKYCSNFSHKFSIFIFLLGCIWRQQLLTRKWLHWIH